MNVSSVRVLLSVLLRLLHTGPFQQAVPLKLGKHICHDDSALQSSVCEGIMFEQREQVLAFLHGQTSDQLFHNLQPQQHRKQTASALWCFTGPSQSRDGVSVPYLSSRGVRIDGDLARASSMAVDGGAHLLPHQQGGNLLLRGNKLPSLGLLQGFSDESGVALDVCPREALAYPGTRWHCTHLLQFILHLK